MTQKDQANNIEYLEDEISLVDYLVVLLKRKRLIIIMVLLAVIFSGVYVFLKPNVYTATARILPPQESSPNFLRLLSSGDGAFGGLAESLMGGNPGPELYVGILESRTVADQLIKKFNLKDLYENRFLEDTYKMLSMRTKVQVSRKTQIISVSVEDTDPQRAADMANTYTEALDQINRQVSISEGHRKRVFLEGRLQRVKEDLLEAESELKRFQQEHNLVAIEDQARVAIEGAAKIKGEIIAAETELEVLKQFGTERQNEAIILKSKITELQNQLGQIEAGNPSDDNFYIPFKEMPALAMHLARLIREAKIQEEVFKLITTQYELAKIEEAKDMNTIQVLDRAVPPDRKSGPKRFTIMSLSAIVVFVMSVLLVFVFEYATHLMKEDRGRYQKLVAGVRFGRNKGIE